MTTVLRVDAVKVIEEIDALPADEQSKVIAHLHKVQEKRFHAEQIRVAEKRLENLDNGLTSTVSHKEAMRVIRRNANCAGFTKNAFIHISYTSIWLAGI